MDPVLLMEIHKNVVIREDVNGLGVTVAQIIQIQHHVGYLNKRKKTTTISIAVFQDQSLVGFMP